jgi:hypothetical protein
MNSENVEVRLLLERVMRLEGALAELADETHGVSHPGQLVSRGKPWLASLLADARSGALETMEHMPEEVR